MAMHMEIVSCNTNECSYLKEYDFHIYGFPRQIQVSLMGQKPRLMDILMEVPTTMSFMRSWMVPTIFDFEHLAHGT